MHRSRLGPGVVRGRPEHRHRRRASARVPQLRLRPHRQPHRGRREGPGHGDAAAHGLHGHRPNQYTEVAPPRARSNRSPTTRTETSSSFDDSHTTWLYTYDAESACRGRAPEPHHRRREAGASATTTSGAGAEGGVHALGRPAPAETRTRATSTTGGTWSRSATPRSGAEELRVGPRSLEHPPGCRRDRRAAGRDRRRLDLLLPDANGNVGQVVSAADGATIAVHYEYDPYGTCLFPTGPLPNRTLSDGPQNTSIQRQSSTTTA